MADGRQIYYYRYHRCQFSGKSTFLNYDKSVYVGEGDDFHRLFEVEDRDVHEHVG